VLHTPPKTQFARLRHLLEGPDLGFLMEAHNGLSAKIVEEAGFEAIWASGLSISAALGVRDNNELSWTQVLDVLEYMADAADIPILVDGDTGYGNFNNFRRLVKKLCDRGIAGVCIEDKIFPKTNSFLSAGDDLADPAEFCGKIKAGKDTQTDPDFCVVARIEALIAGAGMDAALTRAEAYAEAGADALVIHSRRRDAGEVLEFCRLWDHRVPVILIPTKYYRTPTDDFRQAGAAAVIWANHNLRASIQAMRDTSRAIRAQESLVQIEPQVAPLNDVFALANAPELEAAEARYLAAQPETRAIVLAATRGEGLGRLTEDRPKCMMNVRGQSILARQVAAFRRDRIEKVTVVAGYKHDTVDLPGLDKRVNADFETTGEAASLACAADALTGETVVSYGDIVFEPFFLGLLREQESEIAILVDPDAASGTAQDRVACSHRFEPGLSAEGVRLTGIGPDVTAGDGQWVGLMRLSAAGAERLAATLAAMQAEGTLATADLAQALTRMLADGAEIGVAYVSGNWRNVNDLADLAEARNTM